MARYWPDYYEVIASERYPGFYALKAKLTGTVYDNGYLGESDAMKAAAMKARVDGPDTFRVCSVCGCDPTEHNYEAHYMEARAERFD